MTVAGLLLLFGLASITVGAAMLAPAAGFVVAGVALVLLASLVAKAG